MAFNDGEAETQRDFQQRTGELADAPAGCGNDATLAHFAAHLKTTQLPGAADLPPEAEGLPGQKDAAMNIARGEAEIVNFAKKELPLAGIGGGVERRDGFREDEGEILGRTRLKARTLRQKIPGGALGLEAF